MTTHRSIKTAYDFGTPVPLATTWEKCRDACTTTANCNAWSINPKNVCQLKKIPAGLAWASATSYQADAKYVSATIAPVSSSVAPVSSAAPVCGPKQPGYEYVAKLASGGCPAEYVDTGCAALQCKRPIPANEKLTAGANRFIPSAYDVGTSFEAADWKTCQKSCIANTACKAWTHTPNGQCQFKSTPAYAFQDRYYSGDATTKIDDALSVAGTYTAAQTEPPAPPAAPVETIAPSFFEENKTMVIGGGAAVLIMMLGCSGMMMMMTMN